MSEQNIATTKKKFQIHLSLTLKLVIGLTVICSVAFVWIYTWFMSYSTRTAMQRIKDDLVSTLEGAVKGINGDDFAVMLYDNGYTDMAEMAYADRASGYDIPESDPHYATHQNWLIAVHNIEPRANPYTYVKGYEEAEVLFVGDFLRYSQPENATLFLESYPDVIDMPKGLIDTFYSDEIYTDDWGSWLSGYSPIKDSNGVIVGGIGIDFKADYVFAAQQEIRERIIPPLILAYLALVAVVSLLSILITRPVSILTKIAEKIGEGDYNQDFSSVVKTKGLRAVLPDELDRLSKVFELMVGKVEHREQNLRIQVQKLQIEIDESKRQNQVSEIVDTDFFRDLQSKAEELRAKRRNSGI